MICFKSVSFDFMLYMLFLGFFSFLFCYITYNVYTAALRVKYAISVMKSCSLLIREGRKCQLEFYTVLKSSMMQNAKFTYLM